MKKFINYTACVLATAVPLGVTFYMFTMLMKDANAGNPDYVKKVVVLFVVLAFFLCLLFSYVASDVLLPLLKMAAANAEFKKSDLKKRLMEYVEDVFRANPELQTSVKYVNLSVCSDEDMFQARAIGRHTIKISSYWVLLASCTAEGFEMVKTTICHELAHLYVHSELTGLQYIAAFLPAFGEKGMRHSWYKEFEADHLGRKFYVTAGGNINNFINKGKMLLNTPEGRRGSTKLTDHPNWEARIECLVNNTSPDKSITDDYYNKHRDSLKKKKKQ